MAGVAAGAQLGRHPNILDRVTLAKFLLLDTGRTVIIRS